MTEPWAASYVGLPYTRGGATRTGLDCWGLVQLVYREQRGIELPQTPMNPETRSDWHEVPLVEAMPFDVLEVMLLGGPYHVGLVVGQTHILHALEHAGVVCEPFTSRKWRGRVVAAHRYGGVPAVPARAHV